MALERHENEPGYLGNLTELTKYIHPENYPQPGSDICALMVLEHQAHMHNYITRLRYESETMLRTYGHIRYLKHQEDAFLRYLLLVEEAPLPCPVEGCSSFAQQFASGGPRDSKGRSLRDLDLHTRMFKYPCSYLIYSDAFDSLPAPMSSPLLERLYAILTGSDKDPQFAKLTTEDRLAILQILRETKPNLPDYWRGAPSQRGG